MAFTLSRIDRHPWSKTEAQIRALISGGGPASITGLDVAALPKGSKPTSATTWTACTYTSATASTLFAGPDASPTGAIVVAADSDLWGRVTTLPEVDAFKIERITVLT